MVKYDLVLYDKKILRRLATITGSLPRVGEHIHHECVAYQFEVKDILYHTKKSNKLEHEVSAIEVIVKKL